LTAVFQIRSLFNRSNRSPSPAPVRTGSCALLALLFFGGAPSSALERPLRIRDTATNHEWTFTRAQGGGVTYILASDGPFADSRASFLHGAGFRLRVGCDSFDPARSRWRFRVEMTAPATDITGEEECAFDEGTRSALSAPGQLLLFDEVDKLLKRFPLVQENTGLTSEALRAEDVSHFYSASWLRVETTRLELEAGLLGINRNLVVLKPELACRRG
jgi:hypothetical protein